MKLVSISEREREWAKNKPWPLYLVLLLVMGYVGVKQILIPTWQSVLDVANFGIHELGHPFFSLFGDFMHALGGTIFELGVPLLAIFVLFEQRMYFASAAASIWLTTACYSVSIYASDASARLLPLASISGEVDTSAHDWYYLLDRLGWLEHDQLIGHIFAGLGILAAIYGLYRGIALLKLIFEENSIKNEQLKTTKTS